VEWEGYCPTCGEFFGPDVLAEVLLDKEPSTVAISNRGIRHETNQDSIWVGSTSSGEGPDDIICIVLCDGVSSAYRSEFASRFVTHVVGKYVLKHLTPNREAGDVLIEATEATRQMLIKMIPASTVPVVDGNPAHDLPSATIVAAVIQNNAITIGWLGDSRAYWVTDEEITLLTSDDSYASILIQEQKASSYVEALNMRNGHAITACVAEDCDTPLHVREVPFTEKGLLILCSDGLWNYLIDDIEFGLTVNEALQNNENIAGALHSLVEFAYEQGGMDNISIAFHRRGASPNIQQTPVDLPS
jgi:serine/threonine protein phosphatase PrpC